MSSIIVLANIWLVECSPSLRSDCMVLPYLKGFDINKDLKFIYFVLVLALGFNCSIGYISILIYLQVIYIKSGIRVLSWAKRGDFFLFLQEFFGVVSLQIRSETSCPKFAKTNCTYGFFAKKIPKFKKKSA